MSDIAELRAKSAELNAQIWAAEAKERDEQNAALVGRCFKYRNCYSCPDKESDYWWLYRKIVRVENGHVRAFAFQLDSRGEYRIRPNDMAYHLDGWKEITTEEYAAAWNNFVEEMNAAALAAGL